MVRLMLSSLVHFNPRSLTGATEIVNGYMHEAEISIHAPLRERPHYKDYVQFVEIFQSTLPHGSDSNCVNKKAVEQEFQSTLPHGSD